MKASSKLHIFSVLIMLVAIGAWAFTGREGYTRWPNTKLEQTDAPTSKAEDDLLAEIGFETSDDHAIPTDIKSRFVFGLVPGGLGPKHLPSVASATALAMGISAVTVLFTLKAKAKHQTTAHT